MKTKASILAVDDDVHILRLRKRALEAEGFAVITVNNGEEALNLLAGENPDLVLLDITMSYGWL